MMNYQKLLRVAKAAQRLNEWHKGLYTDAEQKETLMGILKELRESVEAMEAADAAQEG